MPPSKGQKADSPDAGKPHRRGRPGVGRMLEPDPDRVVDAKLQACPHCATSFPAGKQTPQEVYDRIEIPPIKPDVTRVRLFGGQCTCCGQRVTAEAPPGLEPGSPFWPVGLRAGGLPALRPRHRLRTAGSAAGRGFRPAHQRRCDQQHAAARVQNRCWPHRARSRRR